MARSRSAVEGMSPPWAGVEQDVARRLASALGDVDMQPLQGGIAFGGIDEGGHQSWKALLAEERLCLESSSSRSVRK